MLLIVLPACRDSMECPQTHQWGPHWGVPKEVKTWDYACNAFRTNWVQYFTELEALSYQVTLMGKYIVEKKINQRIMSISYYFKMPGRRHLWKNILPWRSGVQSLQLVWRWEVVRQISADFRNCVLKVSSWRKKKYFCGLAARVLAIWILLSGVGGRCRRWNHA